MEHILNMANRAAHQYPLISSYVTGPPNTISEPPDPVAWTMSHNKPTWLIAIDYSTLVSLLLVIFISAILLASTGYKSWHGRAIRLDTGDQTGGKALTRKEVLANTLLQNMDHTLHEDGEAVDEAKFWKAVSPFSLNMRS